MNIPAIGTYYTERLNKIQNHNNNRNIQFGFGLDYGDDDYLDANSYVHKQGNGSVFRYLKLIGIFFIEVIKEKFGITSYSDYNDSDEYDDIVDQHSGYDNYQRYSA